MLNLITAAPEPVGFQIAETKGDVSGVSVRTRHIFTTFCIAGRMIVGGEVKTLTKALVRAREESIERMSEEAEKRGANAVVSLNVQVSGFIGVFGSSVCASGTAVRIRESQ